jgi:hypothetical protein
MGWSDRGRPLTSIGYPSAKSQGHSRPWLLTGIRSTCEGCNFGAESEKRTREREAPVSSPVKFPYAKCRPFANLAAITSLLRSLVSSTRPT